MSVKLIRQGECGEVYWREVHCDVEGCSEMFPSYTDDAKAALGEAYKAGWVSRNRTVHLLPSNEHYPRTVDLYPYNVRRDLCPNHGGG